MTEIGHKKMINVIVVDDSALIRALLTEIINKDSRLQVVAAACDPFEARELIKKHNPDVITLDIEMPKMNGIAFLKNLMRLRPMPVVMISTLTQEGAPTTLEALELGAVDFIPKPKNEGPDGLVKYSELIADKLSAAAKANVLIRNPPIVSANIDAESTSYIKDKKLRMNYICAIGASTGGTEAIKEVVSSLPEKSPAIVIAQHIPDTFSSSFSRRIDSVSAVSVCEAEHDQPILPGHVYIAPGHSHLKIAPVFGGGLVCKLEQSAVVNRHRPSVEVLFDSVRDVMGKNCMGVLLTGMGADGSEALLRLQKDGCETIAQDENTSIVWGMPGVAVSLGAANHVLPLTKIAHKIITLSYR